MDDIHALNERAKELRCLYSIGAIISEREQTPSSAFLRILQEIPAGWQHPDSTGARIDYLGCRYVGPGFASDGHLESEAITLWDVEVGRLAVSVRGATVADSKEPFLREERELLRRIASRLAEYLEWKHTELLGDRTVPKRDHWVWRQRFAEALADHIDCERFGVARMFLGGSTARGDAKSASDIDLYIDCHGTDRQKEDLTMWLEGWSLCLGEVALQQTGQPFPEGILNVQWLEAQPGMWQRSEMQELKLRKSNKGK